MRLIPRHALAVKQREGKRSRQNFHRFLALLFLLIIVFGVSYWSVTKYLTATWATKTLVIPPEYNIGVDYYHESMGYLRRTNAEIDRDLDQIQQVTHKIKVYHNPFTYAGGSEADSLGIVRNIVQRAKARKGTAFDGSG